MEEVGGSDLYGAGSGNEKLGGIAAGDNAAQSNDGKIYSSGGFVNETQGQRFDGGAGETAETGANVRRTSFYIDCQ
jgi:hypothetical protein